MGRTWISGPARFVILGIAGLAVVGGVAARAEGQLACGGVVGPGESVTLTGDFGPCDDDTDTVTAAITVNSGTLDLGGFTVSCADTDLDAIVPDGIVLIGTGAVVTSGTVTGCNNGVVAGGTSQHTVHLVTADENDLDGFRAEAGSDKNVFTNNTARNNGDDGFDINSTRTS